ncbi:hypothetical protein GXW84_26315 [Rhodococcus sp. IEGM 248]|nr:hypothetical protein [Rhodococcus sp. IEGM 248]RZL85107.1 MAG: hypothetical protein EOP32_01235 [Rhodococcus sp. (in: high G+C Gram-positive bacteria)]
MGTSAMEQLWQTLSENGLALVCVRDPLSEWADLMTRDQAAGDLTSLANEASEIAEQFPFDTLHRTAPRCRRRS